MALTPSATVGFSGRCRRDGDVRAGLVAAVMLTLAVPALSLRTGASDAGNDASGTTSRHAFDLIANRGLSGKVLLDCR